MEGRQQQVHKSGALKQRNKTHKHGRHKSKGEINDTHKGRVGLKSQSRKGTRELRKADKKNQRKQLRANQRQAVLDAKRSLGTVGNSPHLVVVIPLSPQAEVWQLHALFCQACDMEVADAETIESHPHTLISHTLKHRYTFVYPSTSELYTLLDIAKVADVLLLVHGTAMEGGDSISSHGSLLLDCLMAQGLPTSLHLLQGVADLKGKAQAAVKKAVQKSIASRFPSEHLHLIDSVQHAKAVLRAVSNHKRRPVLCRDQHSYLLVEDIVYKPEAAGEEVGRESQEGTGTLLLSGYICSRALSVNSLLHIPGLGDFQMTQVDSREEPRPFTSSRSRGMDVVAMEEEGEEEGGRDGESMEEGIKVLEVADPMKQESLQSEVTPDPMAGEQTWPSEQELQEAEAARREKKVSRRVPKGTSEYQAAWIVETDSEQEEDEGSEEEGMEEGEEPPGEGEWSESEEEEEFEELGVDTETGTLPDTEQYDADVDMDAEKEQLERLRSEREHLQFPDEVDTPTDCLAKTRFQKYRGLKSFRSSPWNPMENLPSDYARIYQFDNFRHTRKRALQQKEEGALPGWYVTLHVAKVPGNYAEKISSPLVVYGLLPHENKMSVLHYVIRRTGNYSLPIKSKDQLVFHTGVRRYSARPIFSQHSSGDKHKFERFLPCEGCYVASVYAPIGYPPQPVLLFHHQELQGGGERPVLVATGSLHRVQPQRIVCKRIVLSGHPYKINKRSAVIRYMFFNREDILWFKRVELRTKYGRRGHIKEPLGTHGHMKCVFDGHLKAQDTVLMYLYKRVYPKWSYCSNVPKAIAWKPAQDNDKLEQEIMQN